ncbi:MAG: methyltransferase domain-containing protein [Ardenticatenaceae bacterium]|nr:methyltransferase domain-containing protein [Ardenticatenaceae bacterium]
MTSPVYEATCFRGTERWVLEEIRETKRLRVIKKIDGGVLFEFKGESLPPEKAGQLKLPTTVSQVVPFDIPRPKALLGDQNFRNLTQQIQAMVNQYGKRNFSTIGLQAAGRDSAVMQRLHRDLAQKLKLESVGDLGEVSLRLRKSVVLKRGWDVLIRLGPRPQATRTWRTANMPGALNGPVAALINKMVYLSPDDRLLNVACGSGTLLIEVAHHPQLAVGGDLDSAALIAARLNLAAAAVDGQLVQLDGANLPFAASTFEVVTADLPWGQLVGDDRQLNRLYEAFVDEAVRVLTPGGRMAVVTHEVRRYEKALHRSLNLTQIESLSIKMGRVTPRIFIHQKKL